VPSPSPTIFSFLKFIPANFKNSCIGPAALAGLAVRTNKSSVPLASAIFLATLNNGPFFPSITLLNSEKSNFAPLSFNS